MRRSAREPGGAGRFMGWKAPEDPLSWVYRQDFVEAASSPPTSIEMGVLKNKVCYPVKEGINSAWGILSEVTCDICAPP